MLLNFGEYFTLDGLHLTALRRLDLLFFLEDLGEDLVVGVRLREGEEYNILIVIEFHLKD